MFIKNYITSVLYHIKKIYDRKVMMERYQHKNKKRLSAAEGNKNKNS